MSKVCLKEMLDWLLPEVNVEEDTELMEKRNPECSGSEMIGRSVDGWRCLILLSLLFSFIKVIYLQ
jgi:hypothetical protein